MKKQTICDLIFGSKGPFADENGIVTTGFQDEIAHACGPWITNKTDQTNLYIVEDRLAAAVCEMEKARKVVLKELLKKMRKKK